ncbi:protease inhibitor I42 family protein [Streptomyces sp. NPDC058274]|uniref:protease inhibitor I42 family protein n=1 Tax=Streptomyces sp. NPDC058274 TaxID=3346416 RepID=UPI0036E8C341
MRTRSTSRSSRGTGAVAAAALLALVAGCGGGTDGPTSHPVSDSSITAGVGERFTLAVNENASTREHWYLADPKPDSSVVRSRGNRYESDSDEAAPGSGGHLVFTFEATGKGTTKIVLLHCTFNTCNDSTASPTASATDPNTPTATASSTPSATTTPSSTSSPSSAKATPTSSSSSSPEPERVTYTVTVS